MSQLSWKGGTGNCDAQQKRSEVVDHGRRNGREEQGDCVMLLFGREVSGMQHMRNE